MIEKSLTRTSASCQRISWRVVKWRPLCAMSESAVIVKLFLGRPLPRIALPGTLQTDGAEDKALPGGNLSADSGAKTRPGFGVQLNPGYTIITGIGMNSDKSQGSGDRVPRKRLSFLSADSFVRSALT